MKHVMDPQPISSNRLIRGVAIGAMICSLLTVAIPAAAQVTAPSGPFQPSPRCPIPDPSPGGACDGIVVFAVGPG